MGCISFQVTGNHGRYCKKKIMLQKPYAMADIRHQFIIKANSQKVFYAMTNPKGLNSWWTLECSGEPVLNETYRFYFGSKYDWRAQVVDVQPGVSLTWQMTDALEDWMPTQVGFTLIENGGKTIVNFFHNNWQDTGDHYAITTFCWGQLLNALRNFVELDITVPFELRN